MKTILNPLFALASAAMFLLPGALHGSETSQSLEEILKTAEADKKPVVLEFTGSDWCPPCKMMEKQVFSTKEFQDFSASDIVFVKLDFPRSKEQAAEVKARNEELVKKFNIEGFPTLVVLDSQGKELARQVGFLAGGPSAVIDWIQKSAKM